MSDSILADDIHADTASGYPRRSGAGVDETRSDDDDPLRDEMDILDLHCSSCGASARGLFSPSRRAWKCPFCFRSMIPR